MNRRKAFTLVEMLMTMTMGSSLMLLAIGLVHQSMSMSKLAKIRGEHDRSLARLAERFYGEMLGLPLCARFDEGGLKMAFFTLGNHHDFAVMEVSGEGSSTSETAVGLHHVAFNIGTTLDELREAQAKLAAAGNICGRCEVGSQILSMSKKRAPGICPAAYSAR